MGLGMWKGGAGTERDKVRPYAYRNAQVAQPPEQLCPDEPMINATWLHSKVERERLDDIQDLVRCVVSERLC